jgi:hypothetical protein
MGVGLVAIGVLSATPAGVGAPSEAKLQVVATDLNNPRKLFVRADGVPYVVEAGVGGNHKCFGTGPDAICVGRSGSVTQLAGGTRRRVITGLPSWATAAAQRAQGAAAVAVEGDTYYVLFGDAFVTRRGGNALGRDGRFAGKLVAMRRGGSSPRVVADLAAYEAAHNPDKGAGPGPTLGNPPTDSNPYALVRYRGGFAIVDAAANDVLRVTPRGTISVLAVLPTRRLRLSDAVARRMGAPPSVTSLDIQAVPSSIAIGPDGALYVGELTGRPFQPGTARIWRIVPGATPTVYADGFTNITDIAFAGRNLLVLEGAQRGFWHTPWTGALIRLAPDRTRTVIARTGLVAPTGLAVGSRDVFISNFGLYPGSGPAPHGQVVRIPRTAA